ncbi:5-methyltetrahydropteroyltriglutamate--homocysteine S-methyltransferase [Breoghania sp.]|uniref:5-methyltetrahydropteroyltriglutamate-- homocysteine S-methyltransferase n=1 Tax=Breoghania sp. TaxID=2065378 RepID=UPI00261C891B|nr:5-methyltetrahydropteroyltriglutamate--homocysteine S-methyltransferase [Breoghania sp.]MDJ0931719.1 5-methyltetrahydropteroyltriglutamate--homocysteine S-methyltransferase [Breoghania sp.]
MRRIVPDHVGSLLRPDSVKTARKTFFEDKSISATDLKKVEDAAIIDVIKMQEEVGLKAVTDSEQRRSLWHYDFMGGLTGFDLDERQEGVQFHGMKLRPIYPTITGKMDFPADHPMIEHFKFAAAHTKVQPKIPIPGPSCCHFRTAPEDIAPEEYKDLNVLFADLAKTYAKAVQAFYDAGCRYLQMDEAIKDRLADMKISMHLCRSNFASTYAAEGAYDLAADAIFNKTGIDIYFMEYDSESAGSVEPLKLLPKGNKRVLPGFITTKTPELESLDDLKRKFEEARKYCGISQLGIAPQCGFSSTEEGNKITMDDQCRKLELVVKTAEAIWGGVDK